MLHECFIVPLINKNLKYVYQVTWGYSSWSFPFFFSLSSFYLHLRFKQNLHGSHVLFLGVNDANIPIFARKTTCWADKYNSLLHYLIFVKKGKYNPLLRYKINLLIGPTKIAWRIGSGKEHAQFSPNLCLGSIYISEPRDHIIRENVMPPCER